MCFQIKRVINEEVVSFLTEAKASEIYEKFYSKIPKEEFYQIIEIDPTTDIDRDVLGKYSKWVLSLYKRRSLKLEDLYKAKEYLETFHKYINRLDIKDINRFKTLGDLYNHIKDFIGSDEPTSKKDLARKVKEGAKKVYDDNQWLVVVPETEEAAKYYGKGTRWCTAAEDSDNKFDHYDRSGTLFINIDKISGDKYQFHFEGGEFTDASDDPIIPSEIDGMEENSGIYKFYIEQGYDMPKADMDHVIRTGNVELLWDLMRDPNVEKTNNHFWEVFDSFGYIEAYDLFWYIDAGELDHDVFEHVLSEFYHMIRDWVLDEDGILKEIDKLFNLFINTDQLLRYSKDEMILFLNEHLDTKKLSEYIQKIPDLMDDLITELNYLLKKGEPMDEIITQMSDDNNIEEETIKEILSKLILTKYVPEKELENKRIKVNVQDINIEDYNNINIKFHVKILFKKDNKSYEGWISKKKFDTLMTQYDLFHGE